MNSVDKIKDFLGKWGVVFTVLLVLVGILLVALPEGDKNEENGAYELTLTEYKAWLEGELSDMCHSVRGVGKCRVMITFLRGEENTYKGSLLVESKPPRVLGVTVICEGADSSSVRANLTEMICALFDIGSNRVAILKLDG